MVIMIIMDWYIQYIQLQPACNVVSCTVSQSVPRSCSLTPPPPEHLICNLRLCLSLPSLSAMEELDGDEVRVSSRGRLAERDIVQVLFNILSDVVAPLRCYIWLHHSNFLFFFLFFFLLYFQNSSHLLHSAQAFSIFSNFDTQNGIKQHMSMQNLDLTKPEE